MPGHLSPCDFIRRVNDDKVTCLARLQMARARDRAARLAPPLLLRAAPFLWGAVRRVTRERGLCGRRCAALRVKCSCEWGAGADEGTWQVLQCFPTHDDWTEDETRDLLDAVCKAGEEWDVVAAMVRSKTMEQCVLQFARLPLFHGERCPAVEYRLVSHFSSPVDRLLAMDRRGIHLAF